jgi:hypothetical protein
LDRQRLEDASLGLSNQSAPFVRRPHEEAHRAQYRRSCTPWGRQRCRAVDDKFPHSASRIWSRHLVRWRDANPDEYVNTSHDVADTSSIMNIGRELRKRHLAAVVTELNRLIPDLTFTVATPVL